MVDASLSGAVAQPHPPRWGGRTAAGFGVGADATIAGDGNWATKLPSPAMVLGVVTAMDSGFFLFCFASQSKILPPFASSAFHSPS